MKNNIILIDCDGVISNFRKMVIDICKNEFSIDIDVISDQWDILKHPKIKKIHKKIWDYILSNRGLIRNMEKFSYSYDLIAGLRERGHVIACTAIVAGGYFADERFNFLIQDFGFKKSDIIVGVRKELVYGDFFIDDKPENVEKWFDFNFKNGGEAILWQTPGIDVNVSFNYNNKINRFNNLSDLFYYIDYSCGFYL